MFKRTLATAIVLLWCGSLYAQDKPTIYRGVYIKAKAGMVQKVEDGFKDHIKKFHKKKGLEVTTFQMMSGPKMGWYLRIMGGADWENFDKYTEPAGDAEHWAKYITPYIDEVPMQFAGQFYARLLSDLSYNYERTSMSRVLTDDVRPGMGGKYYSILSKAKEAEEKTDGEVRYAVYLDWYHNNKGMLVDMRMGALTMEVISVTPQHNNYVDTWRPSAAIQDEECTAKHTIFTAAVISGIGLSQAFNCLHSMQYWQYIWMSLSPFSVQREGLILNKEGDKANDRSQQSDREVVTGTSQRSDVVLHRPTEDREDYSSIVLEYERL